MADRLDDSERNRLFDAVRPLGRALDPDEAGAVRTVYRLLVDGRVVTAAALADATGWDRDRASRFVEDLPYAERDGDGRVVGFGGLTLRQTPHRIVFDSEVRHTWCAWDSLFLPVALDTTGQVTSTCPHTGRQIEVTVTPTAITRRDPDTAVLSFMRPDGDGPDDLRGSFCALIHLFVDDDAARTWTAHVPGTFVLDLDDAFDLGQRCIADRYDTPDAC